MLELLIVAVVLAVLGGLYWRRHRAIRAMYELEKRRAIFWQALIGDEDLVEEWIQANRAANEKMERRRTTGDAFLSNQADLDAHVQNSTYQTLNESTERRRMIRQALVNNREALQDNLRTTNRVYQALEKRQQNQKGDR